MRQKPIHLATPVLMVLKPWVKDNSDEVFHVFTFLVIFLFKMPACNCFGPSPDDGDFFTMIDVLSDC